MLQHQWILLLLFAAFNASTSEGGMEKEINSIHNHHEDDEDMNEEEQGCLLGACYLERKLVDDFRVPKAALNPCQDFGPDCHDYPQQDCQHLRWMQLECPKTCGTCGNEEYVRHIPLKSRHPEKDKEYLRNLLIQDPPFTGSAYDYEIVEGVGTDYGVLQQVDFSNDEKNGLSYRVLIIEHAQQVKSYMGSKKSRHCRNQNTNCMYWAVKGECEDNPHYMYQECAPACMACERN